MPSSKKDIRPEFTVAQYTRLRELLVQAPKHGSNPIELRILDELDDAFEKACNAS